MFVETTGIMKKLYSTQYPKMVRLSRDIIKLSRTLNQIKIGQEITENDALQLSLKKREIEQKIQMEGDETNTLVRDALSKQIQLIDKILVNYLMRHPESQVV